MATKEITFVLRRKEELKPHPEQFDYENFKLASNEILVLQKLFPKKYQPEVQKLQEAKPEEVPNKLQEEQESFSESFSAENFED